jgi:hypothetical protein
VLWNAGAKKYDVFPLDDRFAERGHVPDRPSLSRDKTEFTYYAGTVRVPEGTAPDLKMRSQKIAATPLRALDEN